MEILIGVASLVVAIIGVLGWQRKRKPKGADVTISLDRDDWAFVVENEGEQDASSVVVALLRSPRGTVTVKNIGGGHRIPILSVGQSVRLAALQELLSTTSPATFEVRWMNPDGKEQRRETSFYA
jgi:hypothetical protein